MSMPKVRIIGGGLGGLSAGIALLNSGFRVEIFEKNSHLGGKLNYIEQDGFSFDLGPSILTMPHIFSRVFEESGRRIEDYVQFELLEPQWRNFFPDNTVIDLYADPETTVNKNELLTSRDEQDISRFLSYGQELYQRVERGYFKKGIDTLPQLLSHHGILETIRGFDMFSTVDRGVKRYVSNPYLIDIFNFFCKYVGSSPYSAPAVLNLLPYIQHKFGLWYVRGGLFNLSQALQKLFLELGGKIYLEQEVIGLFSNDNSITSMQLEDGEVVEGDIFVSNMEVIPAYEDLLGEEQNFLKKFHRFEPACSGLVLHLGISREYPQLAHHNFFFSSDPEKHFSTIFKGKKLPEDPTIYLVAPTNTNPSTAPEGGEVIKILPHIPYLQKPPFSREDYKKLRERVLIKLEEMGLTDLRNHIVTELMWTPEDIYRLYLSHRGAIYGVVSDKKKNLGFKAPKVSKKFKNLFFTGGSVNPGGGMPMAFLSGLQVRDKIVKKFNPR